MPCRAAPTGDDRALRCLGPPEPGRRQSAARWLADPVPALPLPAHGRPLGMRVVRVTERRIAKAVGGISRQVDFDADGLAVD